MGVLKGTPLCPALAPRPSRVGERWSREGRAEGAREMQLIVPPFRRRTAIIASDVIKIEAKIYRRFRAECRYRRGALRP